MILTHKQICEGDLIPRFYGVAYEDFLERVTICYLYPFNILIGLARKYWQKVRYYHVENPLEEQALKAVSKKIFHLRDISYLQGLQDGEQVKRHELDKARKEGARTMANKFRREAGLEPLPDDWNAYKGEE